MWFAPCPRTLTYRALLSISLVFVLTPSGPIMASSENPALADSLAWVGNPSTVFINHAAFTANRVGGDPYPVTATIAASQTTSGSTLSSFVTLTNANDPATEPSNVLVLAGANQQAAVLSNFKTNLQVQVQDGFHQPLAGAEVVFSVPPTGPSATFTGSRSYSVLTDAGGQALASTLTANGSVGLYAVTVSASLNGVSVSTSFTLSNTPVGTTTSLIAAPAPRSVYGQSVNLTARVQPASGTLVPAAGVQFNTGSTAIPGCSLVTPVAGAATCPVDRLAAGDYTFTAAYAGDAVSAASASAPLGYTVARADTQLAVSSSATSSITVGSTVMFTAHVSAVAPGGGTPTGGVVFTSSDGTSLNGSAPVALVNGTAQVSAAMAQAGMPVITAQYGGDANFNSAGGTLTESVTPAVGFLRYGASTSTFAAQVNHAFDSISAIVLDTTFSRLAGVTVTFSTPGSGPSATFADTHTNVTTAMTDANGVARPAQFTANALDGTYQLTATVSSTQTASGQPISITFTLKNQLDDPNAETHIYLGMFGEQTTVLTPFKNNLGAQVFDGNGRALAGATVVFSVPASGASGTFPDGSTSYTTSVGADGGVGAPTFTANGYVGTYDVVITVTRNGTSASTSLPFTNLQVATTTTLDIAPAGGGTAGQPVLLSASIRPVAGALVPVATVDFSRDGTPIDGCRGVVAGAGVATCTLSGLDSGSYMFGATYAGDAASGSSSAPEVAYSVRTGDPTATPTATSPAAPTSTSTFTSSPTSTSTSTPTSSPTSTPTWTSTSSSSSTSIPTPAATPTPSPAHVTGGGGGGGGGGSGGSGSHRAAPAPVVPLGGGGGGGSGMPAPMDRAGPVAGAPATVASVTPTAVNADPNASPDADSTVDPDAESPQPVPDDPEFATLSIGLIQADALVPGQAAQLTFLLLNPGSVDASPDLVVQDVLPDGLAFDSVLSDGWTCGADSGQPLTCDLPAPLPAGSQTTLQLLVDVATEDASAALTNTASLSSPSLDPNAPPTTTIDALAFQPQKDQVQAGAPDPADDSSNPPDPAGV
jgi:hypothetical protein